MRIAFATDIHLGATADDFHQQAHWPEGLPYLIERLDEWLRSEHIELLLIGGDLVTDGSPTQIARCLDLLAQITCPALISLGNHDLAQPASMPAWRDALNRWPAARLADAHLPLDGCDVIALNNRWMDDEAEAARAEFRWRCGSPNHPCLSDAQLRWLDETLAQAPADRPAIVMVHADLDALPPALTGLPAPIHQSRADYVEGFNAVVNRHPRVRLVLGGHNHAMHAAWHGPRVHTTCGALSEYPFHVRLLDITAEGIDVTTHSLADVPTDLAPRPGAGWVLGRESDRTLHIAFTSSFEQRRRESCDSGSGGT